MTTGRRNSRQKTTWYIGLPDDSSQFFKEEQVDGAVYNVFLKKIRYHTSLEEFEDDKSDSEVHQKYSQSTFYTTLPTETKKDEEEAKLQWRLKEVRVVKCATLARLVEVLGADDGELDTSYVNAFLSTYRVFSTTAEVIDELLKRYRYCTENSSMKQPDKEGHQKCLKTVLSIWLDKYDEDFRVPPEFTVLSKLRDFALQYMRDSELVDRVQSKISAFAKQEVETLSLEVDDISFDFKPPPKQQCSNSHFDLDLSSSREIAEQLTYIDADLFRQVIPYQCLGAIWSKRRDKCQAHLVKSVFATVNQFNAVSHRVVATVLQQPSLSHQERAKIIEKWIDIAQELRVLKNFSSLKAVISGLQSTPIYRLQCVWVIVNRHALMLFKELAELFSEENNQILLREAINREGTSKFADMKTNSRHKRCQSWSVALQRCDQILENNVDNSVQGTIPYLGTFLTDLTMIDTAFPDTVENGLINFEKRRKEYEILTQIQILQSAASLYRIHSDPEFHHSFNALHVYDESESFELSCTIQSDQAVRAASGGHSRKSGLGYFTTRRPSAAFLELLNNATDWLDKESDCLSVRSLQIPKKSTTSKLSKRQSSSHTTLEVMSGSRSITVFSPLTRSSDGIVVRVHVKTEECDSTNLYKSIVIKNGDHTHTVLENALKKFEMVGQPSDFFLVQVLPNGTEVEILENTNVFYGISANKMPINLFIRRKTDRKRSLRHFRSLKLKKVHLFST